MLILSICILEAKLWSQPLLQAEEIARLHPKSVRALGDLANIYVNVESYEQAVATYERISRLQPYGIYTDIRRIDVINCRQQQQFSNQEWSEIINRAKKSKKYGLKVIAGLDALILDIIKNKCQSINTEKVIELLTTIATNPEFVSLSGFLYEFSATLMLYEKNYTGALVFIRKAIQYAPKPGNYLYEIQLLKLLGKQDEAREKTNSFKQTVYKDPRHYLAYNKLIESLEAY